MLSTETGDVVRELQDRNVEGVWFSNTGKYLVVRSNTGEVQLLGADDLQEVTGLGRIQSHSFDAVDERLLYITEEGTAMIFDMTSRDSEVVNGGTNCPIQPRWFSHPYSYSERWRYKSTILEPSSSFDLHDVPNPRFHQLQS